MLPVLTPEQSKYTSDVLQKLIDIKMERKVKVDSKYCMWNHATGKTYDAYNIIDVDEVIITPPDTNHPNWPKTIEAMKYIIDSGLDRLNGFSIDFNSSFTKFRKTTI